MTNESDKTIPFSRELGMSSVAIELVSQFMGSEQDQTEDLYKDNIDEVYELERRSKATKLLRSYYTPGVSNPGKYVLAVFDGDLQMPQHVGSQFARMILPAFLASDPDLGLENFRSIEAHTDDQEVVMATTDGQFLKIRSEILARSVEDEDFIRTVVSERFKTDSPNGHRNQAAFYNNDVYQFNRKETGRSLENMLVDGLSVGVSEEGVRIVKEAAHEAGQDEVPIIELTKNWPILTLSGFENSKLSLAVHDPVDHIWTFALAKQIGLLSKYHELFDSIGNPESTDIFKREGEILASISFGARYWESQQGFVPILETEFITHLLDSMASEGRLNERHKVAHGIVKQLVEDPESEEFKSLGFVLSNYITTLHEQRRRYGKIKQKDLRSGKIVTELNPLSSDQLCFMIELHHSLVNDGGDHKATLFSTHVLLEDYLAKVGNGEIDPNSGTVINTTDPNSNDISRVSLPDARIDWIADNYKFTTIKERLMV